MMSDRIEKDELGRRLAIRAAAVDPSQRAPAACDSELSRTMRRITI